MTEAIQTPELERLATEINAEHAAAERAFCPAVQYFSYEERAHMVHCGELLVAAQKLLPRGGWWPWIRANCAMSESRARACLRVHSLKVEKQQAATHRWSIPHIRGQVRDQARQAKVDESKLMHELAMKLITIGYRVLATKLHPDKRGGSPEAMNRLNRVRSILKAAI